MATMVKPMTILERHGAKLEAMETAERNVLRAAVAWAPAGRAATEARARFTGAEGKLVAAQAALDGGLHKISLADRELADSLRQLGAAGLTREAVGEGGGAMISDVLQAAAGVQKGEKGATAARSAASSAAGASSAAWRDVLVAYDSLREAAPDADFRSVAALFGRDGITTGPPADAEGVEKAVRERLTTMGSK